MFKRSTLTLITVLLALAATWGLLLAMDNNPSLVAHAQGPCRSQVYRYLCVLWCSRGPDAV